jgi:hypothetical protein
MEVRVAAIARGGARARIAACRFRHGARRPKPFRHIKYYSHARPKAVCSPSARRRGTARHINIRVDAARVRCALLTQRTAHACLPRLLRAPDRLQSGGKRSERARSQGCWSGAGRAPLRGWEGGRRSAPSFAGRVSPGARNISVGARCFLKVLSCERLTRPKVTRAHVLRHLGRSAGRRGPPGHRACGRRRSAGMGRDGREWPPRDAAGCSPPRTRCERGTAPPHGG